MVSILVVMEVALEFVIKSREDFNAKSFNPCCDGSCFGIVITNQLEIVCN